MLALGPTHRSTRLPWLPSRSPSDLTGWPRPSLIPSLIHLRPEPFGAHHLEQAAQVADLVDLTRIQPRRLGKRVGTAIAHDRYASGRVTK
jgi:hypothetical protein